MYMSIMVMVVLEQLVLVDGGDGAGAACHLVDARRRGDHALAHSRY